MRRILSATIIITITMLLCLSGCRENPAEPGAEAVGPETSKITGAHRCLGYYSLIIDTEAGTAQVLPLRTGEWHLNMTGVLNGTMGISATPVPGESDPPNGLFALDITLTHPFASKPQFSGFDVKGILMTPGSLVVGPLVLADVDETCLENADGYTRWWNPVEFTRAGIFGYTDGILASATAGALTATVNPYKLYADILGPTDGLAWVSDEPLDSDRGRGVFTAGSSNTRRYRIRFPMDPGPQVIYGYAIDCSWDFPVPNPPGEIPDDFPIEANQPEACRVDLAPTVNSLWHDSETATGGGLLKLQMNVHDWQGQLAGDIPSEVDAVRVFAPDLMTGGVDGTFLNITPIKARYTADLWGMAAPSEAGPVKVVCRIGSSDGSTYQQGAAPAPAEPISAWQAITVDVIDPECTVDSDNDWSTATPIATGANATGIVCLTDDPLDYYAFDIDLNNSASGQIRLYCDAGTATLWLYDSNHYQLTELPVSGGMAVIDANEVDLMPGEYFIVVEATITDGVRPYALELDTEQTDISPASPVDISPDNLYLDANHIWVNGDYAYAAGIGVWVYDISDPANPVRLSHNEEVTVHEAACFCFPYMYYTQFISGTEDKINMVDFSDPYNPVLYEDVLVYTHQAHGLAMNSEDLYVGLNQSPSSDVIIYNYSSNPQIPAQQGVFQVPYEPQILALLDPEGPNTKAVVGTWGDVLTYDVENPASVTPAGAYNFPSGAPRDIAVEGNYIYVAYDTTGGGEGWLYVLRQTLVPDLVEEGTLDTPGSASYIDVDWPYVFMGDGISGLTICDVTDPATPQQESSTQCVSYGGDVCTENELVYMVLHDAGFEIFNPVDPSSPVSLCRIKTLNSPGDMVFKDDYLVISESGCFFNAIKTIDVTDPQNIDIDAEFWVAFPPQRMALSNDVLVACGSSEWQAFDVSDPLNIIPGGGDTTTDIYRAIGICWPTLFVSHDVTGSPEILVYDISDYSSPTPLGSFPVAHFVTGFAFRYIYMYMTSSDGVLVYDVHDPMNPSYETTYTCTSPRDPEIRGYYLHLLIDQDLEIVDISSPTAPAFAGSVTSSGLMPLDTLCIDGQFAYATKMDELPIAFHIWPPDSPTELGPVISAPYYPAYNVKVHEGNLYFVHGSQGLGIIDLY
jgi:hypothetical protein